MREKIGVLKFVYVTLYVSVEPSELSFAEKEPLASVATGGTSFRPLRRARKLSSSSFGAAEAASARVKAGASSATDRNLFVCMSISLQTRKNSRKVVAARRYLAGIPDLELI